MAFPEEPQHFARNTQILRRTAVHSAGDRVNHKEYGDGTVESANEYHTRITFDAHGLRTFVSSRVVLAPSDTPKPVKAARGRKKAAPKTAKAATATA